MNTENQCDSKTDPPPSDEVRLNFQPGLGSISQPPAYQLVHEHQLGGYSYPPGYQSVPMNNLYNQQISIPASIPNTQQTGIPGNGTSQVIVTQPGQIPCIIVNQQRPADYLCPSLLACFCCFWPTGLVAIYFAIMANSLADKGQMKDAKIMSNYSRNLMIVSVVLGIIGIVFYIMYTSGMLSKNGY
ncbi:proline-rich transmembrane protein 1-like [Mercenaria mercenaria]|uniref:proline-rich transmembrane protein 1-like n=1 Tax=Mercenaria mercenaria TaxID=6596 RepID=UPI00234E90C4|nr:proline-rich transmembrane protein 1-like [Mercenaria mercenaria]